MNGSRWEQITLIHLSDLHFGARHSFNAPSGGDPRSRPKLAESLLADIRDGQFALPSAFAPSNPSAVDLAISSEAGAEPTVPRVVLAITGDFNERCVEPEFQEARSFLESFCNATIFGYTLGPQDIFMVPGNHDLKYAEAAVEDRWSKYCLFYQDHDAKRAKANGADSQFFDPRCPHKLSRIIDQSDQGLIVAEINSSAYVRKDTLDERRGQVDEQAIAELASQLKTIPKVQRHAAIKIALIHHHPVVLPALAEPDRGYDAILNSDLLLGTLKQYGFHIVLHGHKHNPHTFSYDAVCAWTTDPVQPLVLVAGGSAGSEELPRAPSSRNTYNVISIKWHPDAGQARIHVETRGLVCFDEEGNKLPGPEWYWKTLRLDDRLLTATTKATKSAHPTRDRDASDARYDDLRSHAIAEARRNFPAIEVFPSLDPAQGYEASVWIEGQPHPDYVPPARVEWSASPRYFLKVYVCNRSDDPEFRVRFSYYGPTLIQARMFWDDGHETQAYIFARYPRENPL
ncbi:3',5'-cyclic adenosine monophosphate phosphodiesterase CpdA [Paraburkholderia ultramafica]|uniref:3',5'-cyclic adenosine monophosphate phosphodiesterase CpdA n=1 Tax=Paraburkholderia ultramafica TaxID=1544867 RepID=A0A6S7AV18_9BURK|nr:metallophosphoesterase [Paraburkholderia ultramafica]CAB3778798.1 3',5'-cyclic adenosine monophosphate phosphodiesterase CpdA [Paraburkholderia ultramafica]